MSELGVYPAEPRRIAGDDGRPTPPLAGLAAEEEIAIVEGISSSGRGLSFLITSHQSLITSHQPPIINFLRALGVPFVQAQASS